MKKTFIVLVIFGLFIGGCGVNQVNTGVVEREGNLVTKTEEGYILNTGDDIINITSNKVDLDSYLKKDIKVKGMFSGSTLYVDEVN